MYVHARLEGHRLRAVQAQTVGQAVAESAVGPIELALEWVNTIRKEPVHRGEGLIPNNKSAHFLSRGRRPLASRRKGDSEQRTVDGPTRRYGYSSLCV